MLNLRSFILTKIVEPKAVLLQVDDVKQCKFQLFALCRVDLALKDRVLHTLSIGPALSCNLPQASASVYIACLNIISD